MHMLFNFDLFILTIYARTIDVLPRPPFTAVHGLNTGLSCNASPLHYFQMFMTVSLWQYILDKTNTYAGVRLANVPLSRRSLFRNWRNVTMVKMKAFIGLILQMGLVQLSDIKDYWSTHCTLNLPFFRSVFSRDRNSERNQAEQDPAIPRQSHTPVPKPPHSFSGTLN